MTTESSPSSIVIRAYQPSDLSACQRIFTEVNRSYGHPMIYIDMILQTNMNDIEKNYLQVSDGCFWVAVSTDNNRVVGHVAVLPLSVAEPSYYQKLPEDERDKVCELLRMAVDPNVQRAGVGSKLLSTLLDFAREKGYRQVHLTTLASMDKACAFYEKNGFIKGRIEKYPFGDVMPKTMEEVKDIFRHRPKTVIFEADAVIPEEDQRLMKISAGESNYYYEQHFSLML